MQLEQPPFQNHCGFFGRTGGISSGDYESLNCGPGSADDPGTVAENRRIVAGVIAKRRDIPVVTAYQEHANKAVFTRDNWGEDRPHADAIVTDRPDLIIGVLTADCVPVLFEAANKPLIGAAHAGWRGAVSGIIEATIALMQAHGAEQIRTAIGPAIAQKSYEVGPDMQNEAVKADAGAAAFFKPGKDAQHFQFDLPGYVAARLHAAGAELVWQSDVDTYNSAEHFSFRRSTHKGAPDYGRQISAIMIAPR